MKFPFFSVIIISLLSACGGSSFSASNSNPITTGGSSSNSTEINTSINTDTGGNIGTSTTGGNTSNNSTGGNTSSNSTGGNVGTSTTGGNNPGTSTTGGNNPGTGGNSTIPTTGGNTQIANPNFTPFPPCTDNPDDPTCSPSKALVQGNGTCPDVDVPDYQTAVQIATHQSPSTDPCTAATVQHLYTYVAGTYSGSAAIPNCILSPQSNPDSCNPISNCWKCLIDSHALIGGSAGYWFNYTVHYTTNACSKIVWNMDNCFQQACSDSATQKDYANCVTSAQLPVTPNVPKSGLCYKAYGAATIAIYNINNISELDVMKETTWEYYAERLCGN